jgi:hypothetical protein
MLAIVIDGGSPIALRVEGRETMGNGLPGEAPPASTVLNRSEARSIPLPARSLRVSGLLGDDVVFSFTELPDNARRALNPCF